MQLRSCGVSVGVDREKWAFIHYDLSMNMQNNYPSLAYAFVLPKLVLLLEETPAERGQWPGQCVLPPLLMTQNICIHGLEEKERASPCHRWVPELLESETEDGVERPAQTTSLEADLNL